MICVQDPKEADPMMRVQSDLDETKIVLVSSATTIFFLIIIEPAKNNNLGQLCTKTK